MTFKQWNPKHLTTFNSSASSDFLESYNSYVEQQIKSDMERIPHKTFAASSFRCERWSWFRLRGSVPKATTIDSDLNFTAEIGTACHRIIQNNLVNLLGSDWISVQDHIASIEFPYTYTLESHDTGVESMIQIEEPPIRFACDGIIRMNGMKYLLEIKTSEYSAWKNLDEPKPHHIDQVKCYATLLQLPNVLFLYQDRQYGGLKCFEIKISSYEMQEVKDKFYRVMDLAKKNLAPDPLPIGDKWCTPSMCPYYSLCGDYGRDFGQKFRYNM